MVCVTWPRTWKPLVGRTTFIDLMRLEWSGHQGEQTRARFENMWYTVHERVGDTSGYLSDVDRAWRLAEGAYRRSTDPPSLSDFSAAMP